jgi:membrane-associated phospholipid phosphatase
MLALLCAVMLAPPPGRADESQATSTCEADPDQPACPTPLSRSLQAIGAYVTAPARWGEHDWLLFGGALASIAVAHSFDSTVRTHFAGNTVTAGASASPDTLQDALPAAALLAGTWGYAALIDDEDGRQESHAMLEAGTLSVATAYVVGYLAGRAGPGQTTDPNRWGGRGSSFPSEHSTAAFAIGTVLAESGNEQYRWVRRVLGYGVAGFTAYERLHHNAHWLSDTVAGGALGMASAHFALDRRPNATSSGALTLLPLPGGFAIAYSAQLQGN